MKPVLLAIATVLASLATLYLQTNDLQSGQLAWAEWATWGLIALVSFLYSRITVPQTDEIQDKEAQIVPKWIKPRLEKPATGLAVLLVASFCLANQLSEDGLPWSYPLTTIFTSIQLYFHGPPVSQSRPSSRDSSPIRTLRPISPFGRRSENGTPAVLLIGVCLTSSIALIPAIGRFEQSLMVFGMANACATAMAYALISVLAKRDYSTSMGTSGEIQMDDILQPVSLRAFAMTTLYLALSSVPFPVLDLQILAYIVARILLIWSIFHLCFQDLAIPATALLTASASVLKCFDASDYPSLCIHLSIVAAALALSSYGMQRSATQRAWLFMVIFPPIIYQLVLGFMNLRATEINSDDSLGLVHPIAELVKTQNEHFTKMLVSQSRTLGQAVAEYKRRYGRRPPPGFDWWFATAQENDFLLIDEFDTIMESLEPYWGIPSSTLQERYESIKDAPALIEISVRGGQAKHSSDHYHASFLMEWMNPTTWGNIIPDLSFVISTLDEPRVVAPYDTVDLAIKTANAQKVVRTKKPNLELLQKSHRSTDRVKWISVGRQDAWEAMLSSCHIDSPARSELTKEELNVQPSSLLFVDNTTTDMNVCTSPDLLHGHGFLASPESLTVTHSLVPVFAQCKTSIFNDVLYPSPYYEMQMRSGDYNETEDIPWEEKLDRLYWAGTATGGYCTEHNWMQMHRQRLTLMTASSSTQTVKLLQKDEKGFWQTLQSTWPEMAHLFYLKITNVVQCSDNACQAMHNRFASKETGSMEPEPKSAALGSKYTLDIDGNTFSGRYYRLLKSNTCVLKHTAFKEWHDGRLVPWVHFVPVSQGAEELGEMMRFLVREEEGMRVGKEIAERGRDWARRTLRGIDLELVFVRVLLEYARVMNDGRDEMGFEI